MGWSNYIVIDEQKIIIEVSRNIRKDMVHDIIDKIPQLFNYKEELEGQEINYTDKINERAKDTLKQIAYNTYDILISSMEEYWFYDIMFMIWLKKRNIEYRFISEFELEDDKANKYNSITRL